ncbi:hypothetical protein ACLB2K_006665 [Fragaria x ananassa]
MYVPILARTWEEKNVNKWATDTIKELLASVGSVEFQGGCAEISDVSKCVGDADGRGREEAKTGEGGRRRRREREEGGDREGGGRREETGREGGGRRLGFRS